MRTSSVGSAIGPLAPYDDVSPSVSRSVAHPYLTARVLQYARATFCAAVTYARATAQRPEGRPVEDRVEKSVEARRIGCTLNQQDKESVKRASRPATDSRRLRLRLPRLPARSPAALAAALAGESPRP